ncbi:MAG: hypothetical protein M3Y34_05210 [Actinomycetota bacterium]|nr:hypothetical protein [Actinomycetota bacterium]
MTGTRNRRIRWWSGIAGVLVAIGPVAGHAGAAVEKLDGYSYVTKSFELAPGKPKTFKAPCPDRNRVLGGGHYNNGQYGDVIGAHSYPYDDRDRGRKPDDGWAAQLRGFTTAYTVSMYAICAKVVPEYERITRSVAPFSTSSEYGLSCGFAGLDAISGGTSGPLSAREVSSYRGGSPGGSQGWFGSVANHSAQEKDISVLNVCAGLDTTLVIGSDNAAAETQELVSAQCPEAAPRIVGGGHRLFQPAFNTAVAASRPSSNRDGWEVWVDNYNPFDQILIQAHAICAPAL